MDEDLKQPLWRHPGFLLLYSIVATVLAILLVAVFSAIVRPPLIGWAAVGAGVGIAAIFVGVYEAFCRLIEGRPASELDFRRAPAELAVGVLGGALLFSAVVGVIASFGGYRVVDYQSASVMLPALGLGIYSGFTEEIVFRGFLMRLTEKWLGTWAGLAISSILFGLAHLGNNAVGPVAVIAIVEAGLMLGCVYLLTRRLWAAIAVHAAWNFTQDGIFGIAVSGGRSSGILRPVISGPDLLTGGPFGAEASLPAVIVLAIASAGLLYAAWRRGRFVAPLWVRRRAQGAAGAAEQA